MRKARRTRGFDAIPPPFPPIAQRLRWRAAMRRTCRIVTKHPDPRQN